MGRRIGTFTLRSRLLRDGMWTASRIMGMCLVYEARPSVFQDAIQYWAECYRFREIEYGEVIPSYEWRVGEHGDVECVEVDSLGPPVLREA